MILAHDTKQNERLRKMVRELGFYGQSMSAVKNFIAAYTNIAKPQNWEQMSMSTAQGAAVADLAYLSQSVFDGRYMYFSPLRADTILRYDTTALFTAAASWERISMSTAQGAATLDDAYVGTIFDGRYVYFVPYVADTFLRFDTTKSFTDAASWEKINMSTAQVAAAVDYAYSDGTSDGRYVYFCAYFSNTFLRFDTTLLFTNSSAWDRVAVSSVQQAARVDHSHRGACFDGRHIYYSPVNALTFVRFDTTLAFTNTSAWEVCSASSVHRGSGAVTHQSTPVFDGRYVYFAAAKEVLAQYDTTRAFSTSSSWNLQSITTVMGASSNVLDFYGCAFDGRYVYYGASYSDTFLKYDTAAGFAHSSSWSKVSMAAAVGSAVDDGYRGCGFDGKYVYFVPFYADTFARVLACPNKELRQ